MIKAKLYNSSNEIRLTGHANFNPGNDIVCSAVSMLAYSYIAFLKNHGYSYGYDDNMYEMHIWALQHDEFIDGAYSLVAEGLELLADQYPENVHIQRA